MNKTVVVTLKGQRFTLTCEELKRHILACCDTGLANFSTAPGYAHEFVDKTRIFRGGDTFSSQQGRAEKPDAGQYDPVDY